ncbi:type VI secretion system accessory protein TagAB-5 [Burkholderia sp. GbtcB21]|uniref:type VI secretion system accessory protein TagAB-5 n=1 Tax=Burkholderia sp. GbtcB21 TaxID=2824766 RepID=UPI001C2FA4FB|nr:pentapeptide repeat-containing protein [Burkholderia sp. GbtcB21]
MKIVKPESLALLCRTLRFDGIDRLSIGALACFALRANAPVGPGELATEAELWQVAQQWLDPQAPLDEGLPKPAGEFLVYGDAYAPSVRDRAGAPVAVRARIGAACKERLVDARAVAQLAEFRALPPSAPERARDLGPFDERWLASRWPHLPVGTRAEYFHTAPRDQRIAGFWRCDEDIELVNLHADRPVITGALPRVRARCFVERSVAGVTRIDACPMRAETVWLFPGAACGIVLYRALVAIDDEDGDDVVRVIVGWEDAEAPPLPDAAYIGQPASEDVRSCAALASAADDEARADAGLAADGSPSASHVQLPAAPDSPAEPPTPDLSALERDAAALAAQTDALLAEFGVTEADIARLLPARDAPADMNLDELAALAAKLDAQTAQWQAQYAPAAAGEQRDASPSASPSSPASDDASPLADLLRQADTQIRALVEQYGLSRAQMEAGARNRPEFAALADALDALDAPLDVVALTAGLGAPAPWASTDESATSAEPDPLPPTERLADDAPVLAATRRTAPPASDAPLTEPLTREQVIERHARGLGFAGLDLSGLDLSLAVLEHADFRDARIERTCFAGCRLAGASFERALLSLADFSNADLRDASFADASAPGASFRGAELDRAHLDHADFTGGDFSRASLSDSRCPRAQFDASAMTGLAAARLDGAHASFAGCALDAADFTSAHVPRANFQHATLADATFAAAQCEGAEWYGAQAPRAQLRSASLRGSRADASTSFRQAVLSGAALDDASWDGVDLRYANLHKATLDRASLVRAIASGAQLTLSRARHADLTKADLTQTDARFSDLLGASLRRARLDGAQLQSSNLYGADCYGAALGQSQIDGANVERTPFAVPGRPELAPCR